MPDKAVNEQIIDVRFEQRDCGEFLSWNVQVGSLVSPGKALLTYKYNGVTQRFRSTLCGVIAFLPEFQKGNAIPYRSIVARLCPCPHPVIMKDMCANCGMNLRKKDGLPGERLISATARVAMIHSIPELQITTQEAKEYGTAEKVNLLRNRKLVLLVDLDQTLIHTTNEDVPATMKDVMHFQLGTPAWYHMHMRPHTLEFLRAVSQKFELHICTFGARIYAHTVARIMDPDGSLFGQRILSRDECFDPFLKTPNLKALFPCGDHLVCIIDDREDVWNFAPNVVHVKPYRFFKHTGDINAPPGFAKENGKNSESSSGVTVSHGDDGRLPDDASEPVSSESSTSSTSGAVCQKQNSSARSAEKQEEDDDYLKNLENILFHIHDAFYQLYDKTEDEDNPPCLHSVIPYVKMKVLRGVRIVFSGVIPISVNPEATPMVKAAKAFGAEVQNQIVTAADTADRSKWTTHLVAAKWGTEKVQQAAKLNHVHVVTLEWLWYCVERWLNADATQFCLRPKELTSGSLKKQRCVERANSGKRPAPTEPDSFRTVVHNCEEMAATDAHDILPASDGDDPNGGSETTNKRKAVAFTSQAKVCKVSDDQSGIAVQEDDGDDDDSHEEEEEEEQEVSDSDEEMANELERYFCQE